MQLAYICDMPYADEVARYCAERQKPLMIAESTPFGGIVTGDEDNEASVRGSTWNKVSEPPKQPLSRPLSSTWNKVRACRIRYRPASFAVWLHC